MTKVLIVTSESSVRKSSEMALKDKGLIIRSTNHSTAAWHLMDKIDFDLVIIDFQLKRESGLAVYKSLRHRYPELPVLMLGEGKFDEFMLKDLSPKAYDYLLRPFSSKELYEKISGLVDLTETHDTLLTYGELRIDMKQQLVVIKDKFRQLGKVEFKILLLLVRKTGEIVDPKKIKAMLQDEDDICHLSAFYYINRLRMKLHHLADGALEIALIKGQGYRIVFGGSL